MIISLLVIGLIISLGLNVAAYILIRNLLLKINVYELWILDFKTNVNTALEEMRKIDKDATFATSFTSTGKGAFESDDQVGQVFKQLLNIITKLDAIIQ